MKQILVTGINGFVGHHVARELHEHGFIVIGSGTTTELDSELAECTTEYIGNCDLTDATDVARIPLESIDAVINLAGLAQVGASFGQEEKYNHINVAVQTVLADRLLELDKKTVRIIAVSTGAVYDSNQPMPLTEESTLVTQASPYALSKIAMEDALQPYKDKGLDIVVTRPFNHIGPGQAPGFLVPDLAKQLSETEPGAVMKIGNLTTRRDYTDVRDVARAYRLLATADTLAYGVYNVCSGKSIPGTEILAQLQNAMSLGEIKTEVDESRFRPTDAQNIYGNAAHLFEDTGWKPEIPLQRTITDFIAAR